MANEINTSYINNGLVELVQRHVVSEEVLTDGDNLGPGRLGRKRGRLYLTVHRHHHNDLFVERDSGVGHFIVSLTVTTKSQDSVYKAQLWKRKESRSGIEPTPFCLLV